MNDAERPVERRLASITLMAERPVAHLLRADREATLGRGPDCTIRLDDPGIEPLHARLWCHGGRWIVTEAPSNDAVWVNGQPVEGAVLAPGDRLAIGPLLLRFDGWLQPHPGPHPYPQPQPTAALVGRTGLAPIRGADDGSAVIGDGSAPGAARAATPSAARHDAPAPPPEPVPVILLAFADAHGEADGHLRHLVREQHTVTECLRDVERSLGYRVVCEANVTRQRLFDLLDRFDDRIVAVHYGGHASPEALMVEDVDGRLVPAWAGGLLRRLAHLPRLALLFFNGCETEGLLEDDRWRGAAWVVATRQSIRDRVACDFARRFYTALAWGSDVVESFARAQDEMAARFRDPDETLRMLRPGPAPGEVWPWRMLAGRSTGGGEPWRLAASSPQAQPPGVGRVVFDAAIRRRSASGRLHLELVVRNVGSRLATITGVLLMPFGSAGRSTEPPVPPPNFMWDPDMVLAPMPSLGTPAAPRDSVADHSIYDADAIETTIAPDGTITIPVARYVPPDYFDNFLIRTDRAPGWREVGVSVIYDRGQRAVAPIIDLSGGGLSSRRRPDRGGTWCRRRPGCPDRPGGAR